MAGSLVLVYIVLWAASFGAGWLIGGATGRRYDALCLTGILGLPGLLILGTVLVLDRERASR